VCVCVCVCVCVSFLKLKCTLDLNAIFENLGSVQQLFLKKKILFYNLGECVRVFCVCVFCVCVCVYVCVCVLPF
jgi:hypothetical protein